ncbi:MAG: thiolase family protein [Myxococcota bacterium]
MSDREVYLVGSARTPIGAFQGTLASVDAVSLGAAALKGALSRAEVEAGWVDETWMGNVLSAGLGQAPARQAAKSAGIKDHTPATTVSKVCGSGLMSVILGTKSILLGDAELVVAGGMESMSNAPYLLPKARAGFRMGHARAVDSMIHDGLWDPYHDFHMGNAGDLCAKELGFSREEQDAFATESYRRAHQMQKDGATKEEIVPVQFQGRKGEVYVDVDEEPGLAKPEKVPRLRPAFSKDGSVTAANASKINDGAAAVVLASGRAVKERGLSPLARVVAYASHAQAPEWFTTAPIGASKKVLEKAGRKKDAVGLWEINEAFSVVALACTRELELDPQRVNVRGGAVALGHPIGASGARILVTLLSALQAAEERVGVATICLGGGEALALMVEYLG